MPLDNLFKQRHQKGVIMKDQNEKQIIVKNKLL